VKENRKPQLKHIVERLPLEKFIPAAILVFLLCFIILSLISYNNIELYRKSLTIVDRTNEILRNTDRFSLTLTQMQLHRRSYIVKRDHKFLADYENSKRDKDIELRELKGLVSENSPQINSLNHADSVSGIMVSLLDSSLMIFEKDQKITPVQTELALQSQVYLDEVLDLMSDVKAAEFEKLVESQDESRRNLENTQLFIIGTSLFAFIVLGLSLFISTRLIRNKNTAERLLKRSYDELEDRVEERTLELKHMNENLQQEINTRIATENSLRESESRFKDMADSAPQLIWMAGPDKLCFYFNKGWLDFTGKTITEEAGNGWRKGIHPEDIEKCMGIYTTAFDKKADFEMEFRLRSADGSYRWILDKGVPRYVGSEFAGYIGVCVDIHTKKRNERYLKIQYSVSKTLAEARSTEEALKEVLKNICTGVNWKFGIAWVVENNTLIQKALWSENKNDGDDYLSSFDTSHTFKEGVGIPGRVWKQKRSLWVENIQKDPNIPGKEVFKKLGWNSAFAIPISDNANVISVIECFNKQELSSKEDLLEVLESVGGQIGNFLVRKKAEEKLKESYDELEKRVTERTMELAKTLNRLLDEISYKEKIQNKLKLFAHAIKDIKECVYITDLNSKTLFVNSAFESLYGCLEEDILGKKIPVLYSDKVTEKIRNEILTNTLRQGWKGELENIRTDGTLFYINLSASVVRNDEGKAEAIVGIAQDITSLKETEQLIAKRTGLVKLLNDVILVTNKSFFAEASVSYAINKMCEYTSWDVGHCFFVSGDVLISSGIWNGNLSTKYLEMKNTTDEVVLKKNEGMPGRCFASARSFWMNLEEFRENKEYGRIQTALRSGLRTGIWVPIIKQNEVAGVLEFFHRDEKPLDEEILECIRNIGIEIGSLMERNSFLDLIKEREAHFKAVADTANEAIITVNSNGKIIYGNQSVESIFGYPIDELMNRELTDLMPGKYKQRLHETFNKRSGWVNSDLVGRTIELEGMTKKGAIFPIELSIAEWKLNDDFYFTGMLRDISLRKQIENELIDKQKKLEASQKLAKLGSWEWDIKDDFVTWSDEMFSIYEINTEEFEPNLRGFLEYIHPEDINEIRNNIEQAIAEKLSFSFFERIITPGGTIKILQSQGEVKTDEEGNSVKLIGTCQDITELKTAEENLRTSEERFRFLLENVKDYAIIFLDTEGNIISWNKGAEQIIGYNQNEVLGKHVSLFYTDEANAANDPQKTLKLTKETGRVEKVDRRLKKDGSLFWADIVYTALYDDQNNLKGFIKITRDITERKQIEEEIKKSEKRLKDAQKIAKLGNWDLDIETGSISWSDEMYSIFDIDRSIGSQNYKFLRDYIYDDDREMVGRVIKQIDTDPVDTEIDFRVVTPGGRLKYVSLDIRVEKDQNGKPIRVYGSIQDITDIKLVEEELRKTNAKLIEAQKELIHNEKLAALGRFSSGIAHEIRNPLANISALAQLISKTNIEDEKTKKHLKYILLNTDIANKIIGDLLNFASPEELVLRHEKPGDLIENILNSIEPRCIENKIKLDRQTSEGLPVLKLDKTKLENALMNFLSNSIDAMPGGGNLVVKTRPEYLSHEVIIDIIDNGQGIPLENLDKIFEPFFTTKESGTGLGLGLAYQTIKLHHGILNIYSEPGKGTHIEIKLPIKS
jgi:PAS domain S-box-containing protein